jgi:hypothetical protein
MAFDSFTLGIVRATYQKRKYACHSSARKRVTGVWRSNSAQWQPLAPLAPLRHHQEVQLRFLLPFLVVAALAVAPVASGQQLASSTTPSPGSAIAESATATPMGSPKSGDAASSGAQRPLPAISDLIKGITAHQEEVETVRKNYIFTMEEDEQEPDGHGSLRLKHHNVYEVHYSGPWVVQTLISQDGRQLSPDEIRAQQQEQSDKQMLRARQGLTKLQSDPDAQGNSGVQLSDFLAADDFINMRRERFRGYEALVLDFVPNPNFTPRKATDKLLKSLSGTVWIDERDLHVIRLEAHLFNNVNFGGVLASVRKGTAVVFEQQKVNGEIWLPSYTELHFDARELFTGKHINLVQRFRDYKKFRVESEIKPI